MKTVWIVVGVFAFLALACCGGIFFLGKGALNVVRESQSEADTFAAQAFQEIARDWNPETARKYASPEYSSDISAERFKGYRDTYGKLKSVEMFNASGHFNISSNNGVTTTQVGSKATAVFDKGEANVQIVSIKRGQEWKIMSLELAKK